MKKIISGTAKDWGLTSKGDRYFLRIDSVVVEEPTKTELKENALEHKINKVDLISIKSIIRNKKIFICVEDE